MCCFRRRLWLRPGVRHTFPVRGCLLNCWRCAMACFRFLCTAALFSVVCAPAAAAAAAAALNHVPASDGFDTHTHTSTPSADPAPLLSPFPHFPAFIDLGNAYKPPASVSSVSGTAATKAFTTKALLPVPAAAPPAATILKSTPHSNAKTKDIRSLPARPVPRPPAYAPTTAAITAAASLMKNFAGRTTIIKPVREAWS